MTIPNIWKKPEIEFPNVMPFMAKVDAPGPDKLIDK